MEQNKESGGIESVKLHLPCKFSSLSLSEILRARGYIVRDTIGEGTYSKVKRTYSVALKKDVAIKIIERDEAPEIFRQRFLPREVDILSQVKHPNIITIYQIFETADPARVYIVSEYMQCGDLLDLVKDKGALDEIDSRCIFDDICRAVAYLHENNIAHRDIKCENILLDHSPVPRPGQGFVAKLCDFGFARQFPDHQPTVLPPNHEAEQNSVHTFCGSVAYASPEILDRAAHNPMRADVWALGIVFFITIYGTMPFDDSNIKKMVTAQRRGDVVHHRTKKVSRLVRDFISKALRPNPKVRPSVDALLVHRWLRDDITSISPT